MDLRCWWLDGGRWERARIVAVMGGNMTGQAWAVYHTEADRERVLRVCQMTDADGTPRFRLGRP